MPAAPVIASGALAPPGGEDPFGAVLLTMDYPLDGGLGEMAMGHLRRGKQQRGMCLLPSCCHNTHPYRALLRPAAFDNFTIACTSEDESVITYVGLGEPLGFYQARLPGWQLAGLACSMGRSLFATVPPLTCLLFRTASTCSSRFGCR